MNRTLIAERKQIENALKAAKEDVRQKNEEITQALEKLRQVQAGMIQQEKMAGIGQLAAGVAHEINNPLGFVTSNVETLESYFQAFCKVIARYRELGAGFTGAKGVPLKERMEQIRQLEQEEDLEYICNDLPELFQDTHDGLVRIGKIVKGMRLFSRSDSQHVFAPYDLNTGLDNTLLVACNEVKYHAVVERRHGQLPAIEAVGSEINQVLLNLIINAVYAIKLKNAVEMGVITISTWHDEQFVYCTVEDSGVGIKTENMKYIFNPFFTTKPVGQGTGLGLSISYDIIVNRHQGEITAESVEGQGTKFTVKLPCKHHGL